VSVSGFEKASVLLITDYMVEWYWTTLVHHRVRDFS